VTLLALFGGLALLLYGMQLIGEGLQRAAGGHLRHLLTSMTRTRLAAVASGALVTSISPPCAETMRFASVSPSPTPPVPRARLRSGLARIRYDADRLPLLRLPALVRERRALHHDCDCEAGLRHFSGYTHQFSKRQIMNRIS